VTQAIAELELSARHYRGRGSEAHDAAIRNQLRGLSHSIDGLAKAQGKPQRQPDEEYFLARRMQHEREVIWNLEPLSQ
jgi:hypothetical protein